MRHPGVKGVLRLDQHVRLHLAEAVATGDPQSDLPDQAAVEKLALRDSDQVVGSAGLGTGAGGYDDSAPALTARVRELFLESIEIFDGTQFFHAGLPFRSSRK